MNKKQFMLPIPLPLIFFFIFTCDNSINNQVTPDQDDLVQVYFNITDTSARSVLPNIPTMQNIAYYKLYGTTSTASDSKGTLLNTFHGNLNSTAVLLRPVIWNFMLEAYDSKDNLVLLGARDNVDITGGHSATVLFNLLSISNSDYEGVTLINIELPENIDVALVETTIDGITFNPPLEIEDNVIQFYEVMPAGDYLINFFLKDSESRNIAVVTELLVIRGGLVSSKTIALTIADFNVPPAPVNVRVTSVSANSISLAWNVTGIANNYNVYRSDSLNGLYIKVNNYTITEVSYTDTSLEANTIYFYKINAVNSDVEGFKSNAVSGITLLSAPANVQDIFVTDNVVNLMWDSINGSSGYNIYRSISIDRDFTKINPTAVTQNNYSDTNVLPDTDYYYKVCGISNGVEGEYSDPFLVTTLLPASVYFNTNGGYPIPAPQRIEKGGSVIEPETITRTGYNFDGWYKEESCVNRWNFLSDTVPDERIIIYAKWIPITYNVRYDKNASDATGIMADSTHIYNVNNNIFANSFVRNNYTFAGWNTSSDGQGISYNNSQGVTNLSSTNGATVILYAIWINNYSVAYNANGGSGFMANTNFVYGTPQALRFNSFSKNGYAFIGWAESSSSGIVYTDNQSVNNLTATAGAEIILYAVWAPVYTVIYNSNGGNGSMANSSFISGVPQSLRLNGFSRTGYTFAGWAVSADGQVVYANGQSVNNLSTVSVEEVTLYAVWIGISFSVSYNSNGGSGNMANSNFTYGVSQNLRQNNFTRIGYTLAGWATSASGQIAYTDEQSVSNLSSVAGTVITLFAVWTGNPYTVVYNANGGSGTMENSSFVYGVSQNLRTNTFNPNPDYVFAGWALSSSGTVVYANEQIVGNLTTAPNAEVVLYAVWQYTIVPGNNLAAKLTWLQTNAISNTDYTIQINANENIVSAVLFYSGRTNISITLKSIEAEHIIGLSSIGRIFIVREGVTLILDNNITLHGRTDNNNCLVEIDGGKLIMNNGSKITGNSSASYRGSGIYVQNQGIFIMNGGKISGNTCNSINYGGGSVRMDNGIFTMYEGEITGNLSERGGGVYGSGTFTMYGGIISNNSSRIGGGIFMNGGIFTMNGGVISGNSASSTGGGVSASGIDFIMNDGEISGNITSSIDGICRGGGVYLQSGNFIIYGGKIIANTVYSQNNSVSGGGVDLAGGTLAMYGGEISRNTISSSANSRGGGIHASYGSITIYSGVVSGNTVSSSSFILSYSSGGGVGMVNNSTLTISGGVIYGNNAAMGFQNTASTGAALSGAAQYGTFNGTTFIPSGNLTTTDNTIRIVNGNLLNE
ncbi:MAG: InlB B-repeat-containing protein [Treponema sp.]|nr:InlB B-repeat-containing protein [Treponema sp.]